MRPLTPHTATDPLLAQLLDEQERTGISTRDLATVAGVTVSALEAMRHPSMAGGKRVPVEYLRKLAGALDFHFPDKLVKR